MANVEIKVFRGTTTYEVTKMRPIVLTYRTSDEGVGPTIALLDAAVRDIKAAIKAGDAG